MEACLCNILGKIGEFLAPDVIDYFKRHGDYVIQYKKKVQLLEEENKKLREKKETIQGKVDIVTNNGKVIKTGVSIWLEDVKQMEREIANFLHQQENGEQMERDIADFLRQLENGEQMERDFANFPRQQENGEQVEREFANFLRQQENGEQMERDFANFLCQQEKGESFKCFPGCMCPNLMWRHKRGKEADEKKSDVTNLITRGNELERLPVASVQSELLSHSPHYYTTFPSRASVLAEIMNAFKDSGIDMIGVHGPGGAGKTTMAKEVAKKAKELGIFDRIVIAVVSKDPDTSKLQKDIERQLELQYEQTSESGRAGEVQNAMLNGKSKILVILDDLWQGLELTEIGIPNSGLGKKGCKILLTSRRKDVFKAMPVHSHFSIGYLEENEAWELFKKVIGDLRVDELIARKVSKNCGRLPIAIVAVGAALKDKEEFEWHSARHKLKVRPLKYIEGIDPTGYTPLKLSYEFLREEDAKSCFLLCCLFPEDAEINIDDLVRYSFSLGFFKTVNTLKLARRTVQTVVEMLKRSYLLLNGAQENFVKMHVVIRDLAISITEEKQAEHGGGNYWPGQQQFMVDHNIQRRLKNDAYKHHTAISLRINDDDFFSRCSVLDCPLAHTLALEHGKSSNKIPNDFFQCMKEARVLDLKSILLELPSSVLKLDLHMLRLSHCELLGDLATIQKLKKNIEILSFEGSTIEELPREIRELTCLRSLDLRGCKCLKMIPKGMISNLTKLEELYVTVGFQGWEEKSNVSIAELKSLTKLTVLHVGIRTESVRIMVQERPDLFKKLINFVIFINFPKDSTLCDPTGNVLSIYDVHHIDDEFRLLMGKVNELRVRKILHLKGAFKDRKDLSIQDHQDLSFLLGKPQLQSIPCAGGSFSKLTFLNISECNSMKYLFSPSCARALQLQTLIVINCSNMEQIIGVVDPRQEEEIVTEEAIIFRQLEHLTLQGLPQFRSFYPKMENTTIDRNLVNCTTAAQSIFNEKVSFPVLTNLVIDELSVEDIWNKQLIQSSERSNNLSFSQLGMVFVVNCDNLVNVFPSNMLPRLQNLKMLHVRKCSPSTLLVEDLNIDIQSSSVKSKLNDVFPKLINLELDNLPS